MSPCILSLDILELSQDVPLASILSTTLCQHKHTCIPIHINYRHPWILQGWTNADCQSALKLSWTSLDYPRMTYCQQAPLRQSIPACQRYHGCPWTIQGWPIASRQTPLSKYPCMPKLPWMSLDYPRVTFASRQTPLSKYPCTPKLPWTSLDYPSVTHCQQADPSVIVSLYAQVTLDIPGLCKGDPLPAGRPLCQSIPVRQSYLGRPWIIQGWPIASRQTPLSKYPCMPKLPGTSLDYPRVTHCQ